MMSLFLVPQSQFRVRALVGSLVVAGMLVAAPGARAQAPVQPQPQAKAASYSEAALDKDQDPQRMRQELVQCQRRISFAHHTVAGGLTGAVITALFGSSRLVIGTVAVVGAALGPTLFGSATPAVAAVTTLDKSDLPQLRRNLALCNQATFMPLDVVLGTVSLGTFVMAPGYDPRAVIAVSALGALTSVLGQADGLMTTAISGGQQKPGS